MLGQFYGGLLTVETLMGFLMIIRKSAPVRTLNALQGLNFVF